MRIPAWLARLLGCRRTIVVDVKFRMDYTLFPNFPELRFVIMSNEVTLQVNSTAVQTCVVNAGVTVNGNTNTDAVVAWSTSDPAVATVAATPDAVQQGRVTAVRDPDGAPSRTCTITGTVTIGTQTATGTGTVTVTQIADEITVSVDFGTPEFVVGG